MAQGRRPKRLRRDIRRLAAGLGIEDADPLLVDAMFLREHPGWSPHDLAEADAELVGIIRLLDAEEAAVMKSRQRAAERSHRGR